MKQTAVFTPKAEMRLRIYRAATKQWEDGPVVHGVNTGIRGWTGFKLMVLGRLHNLLTRLKSKLEEMQ